MKLRLKEIIVRALYAPEKRELTEFAIAYLKRFMQWRIDIAALRSILFPKELCR